MIAMGIGVFFANFPNTAKGKGELGNVSEINVQRHTTVYEACGCTLIDSARSHQVSLVCVVCLRFERKSTSKQIRYEVPLIDRDSQISHHDKPSEFYAYRQKCYVFDKIPRALWNSRKKPRALLLVRMLLPSRVVPTLFHATPPPPPWRQSRRRRTAPQGSC